MSDDLRIPASADAAAAVAANLQAEHLNALLAGVRAAAPHIVAAELRRMAQVASAELGEAEAEKDRATAGGPRYPDLYARVAALAFHRDELQARADQLTGGGS